MDVFPKFIIETDSNGFDCLIIAKCTFHKQLITDKTKVKGGGWFYNLAWQKDKREKTFLLYASSDDFGKTKLEDIQAIVKSGYVGNEYDETRYSDYNIYYSESSNIETALKDMIKIDK